MSTNEPPVDPPAPPPQEPPAGGGGTYGAPPPAQPPVPPYGGAPYGAPPADPNAWELGAALSYGWKKFQENAAQIIIAALVLFVAIAVVVGIGIGITALLTSDVTCGYDSSGRYSCDGGPNFFITLITTAITVGLIVFASLVVGAGIIRGSLGITEGRPFVATDLLKIDGPVIVASLLVAGLTFVGFVLCYLPGIVVAFATSYTLYFVIDKGLAPVEAVKASVNLVKDNLGNTLVWYIVGGIVSGAGAIACGVGVLVTYPLVIIGTAYTYKKLTGQQVVA